MNKQRAQEIASSPVMAHVTHNGTTVYIQNVDDTRETARIYPIDQPEKEQEVSVNELIEH
ncbi:H-type small acid-soluble spore protein [Bacillus sp. FJAT-49736]|uniref:H-type small acid-soluble spore protein n=1 Tax=Bacillus sp. FJAT-49736 TaxID=2833582 RepID=UPI001BC8F6A4|nr:H-type small acid-soluble spore protein [Bacillus sp. FJAT-49736]MBS4175301.1 H-type small acid-soluble spore protein [Bacillus sp. FJAT-49736]